MSARKPFKPLDEDLDDVADRVAAAKNIPTLTRPAAIQEEGRGPVNAIRSAPQPAAIPVAPAAISAPRWPEPKPKRRGVTEIRIRCPDDVSDQLVFEQQRLRREGQRVTLNYLILSALQKAGYRVDEADLVEDGRRLR